MKCQSFTAAFIGAASEGSVKDLHILADVENNSRSTAQAAHTAGLIAYISGTVPYSISNCSYNGRITSAGGGNHVAGLMGSTYAPLTINGCINRGSVSATDNAASSSTQTYVGGIIGCAQSNVTISQCSNYGSIPDNGCCQFRLRRYYRLLFFFRQPRLPLLRQLCRHTSR